jgi:predicted nucleotidyltransferase
VFKVAELIRLNLELIIERIETALRDFPQVAGAYLFGSVLEACRPDSDIDLGLILEPEIKPDSTEGDRLEAAIAFSLPPVEMHPFDLVFLNPEKPIFVFRVIKEGRLIYCRNRDRVTDVIEYVSRRYADLYPRYRTALEEIIGEVMAGELRP